MEMLEYLDHVVLFSGDGDFRRLVEAVQRRGRRVTVVSTLRSQPPMIADELRRQADNFVDLADMQSLIARQLPADRARSGARLRQEGYHDDHYVDEENDYYERSEEHTSELQSLMRISYAVFCLQKKKTQDY